MTTAETIQIMCANSPDWGNLLNAVEAAGGVMGDRRGDDVWNFQDGSSCRIRCLSFVGGKCSWRRESESPVVEVSPSDYGDFAGDIVEAIQRLQFKDARSMPQIPHSYTLRLKAGRDEDYVALYDRIMQDGIVAKWIGKNQRSSAVRPLRYLNAGDGHWYWSMSSRRTVSPYTEGRHPLWLSHHINRCKESNWNAMVSTGSIIFLN